MENIEDKDLLEMEVVEDETTEVKEPSKLEKAGCAVVATTAFVVAGALFIPFALGAGVLKLGSCLFKLAEKGVDKIGHLISYPFMKAGVEVARNGNKEYFDEINDLADGELENF